MKNLCMALAGVALACSAAMSQAASVYLSPASKSVAASATTTITTFDLFMDFAANEATLGGGVDLNVTGPATLAGFAPSTFFTGVADPAFSNFGTARADNDLEIHFGAFNGLSGVNNLGTLSFNLNGAGTTTLGLSINTFFGDFFSLAGARQTVDLRGATLTVTAIVPPIEPPIEPPVIPAIPEPQTWLLMAAGLGVLGVVTRRRRSLA